MPDVNEFLKPFVDNLSNIFKQGGVIWKCRQSGTQQTSQEDD